MVARMMPSEFLEVWGFMVTSGEIGKPSGMEGLFQNAHLLVKDGLCVLILATLLQKGCRISWLYQV